MKELNYNQWLRTRRGSRPCARLYTNSLLRNRFLLTFAVETAIEQPMSPLQGLMACLAYDRAAPYLDI